MEILLSGLELGEGEPVPWWLRVLGIAAFGLLVAAVMVLIQTKRPGGRNVAWGAVVVLVPVLGPVVYLVWETVRYRRHNPRPTKGRAETMAPEEYQ